MAHSPPNSKSFLNYRITIRMHTHNIIGRRTRKGIIAVGATLSQREEIIFHSFTLTYVYFQKLIKQITRLFRR